jgi:hypothetical protein
VLRGEWASGGGVDALARRLGRSPDALRLRAKQLGLHRPEPRRRWSGAEDVILRDGYADGLTCEQIAAELVPRTPASVTARARRLGLATYGRRWTTDNDARLRHRLRFDSVDRAARHPGRTPEAIRRRARSLGLAAPCRPGSRRSRTRWTAEEDDLLALHAALNPAVLGALLGRSDHAIAARCAVSDSEPGAGAHPTIQARRTAASRRASERSSSVSCETGVPARFPRSKRVSSDRSPPCQSRTREREGPSRVPPQDRLMPSAVDIPAGRSSTRGAVRAGSIGAGLSALAVSHAPGCDRASATLVVLAGAAFVAARIATLAVRASADRRLPRACG